MEHIMPNTTLITGANRGIGLAMAELAVRRGGSIPFFKSRIAFRIMRLNMATPVSVLPKCSSLRIAIGP